MVHDWSPAAIDELKRDIRRWGRELGFAAVGFARPEVGAAAERLNEWLAAGYHGGMDYMARNAALRGDPRALVAGVRSIVCVRLDYFPAPAGNAAANPVGHISRYALGRDYHRPLRRRLQRLAERIGEVVGPYAHRAFADSAPVMEVELAANAGLGWRGKHTLLLSRRGSWFFLGELYTDLPLSPDTPERPHCGHCTACLTACPTRAFVAPYVLDARRCISYLTIEHHGPIPPELRPLVGTHVYGCDDCQTVCPWNRFAQMTAHPDFHPTQRLAAATLAELFAWTAEDFEARLAGSPIRRIGHQRWLRNLAVALGNAPPTPENRRALLARRQDRSPLVREHVEWALARMDARPADCDNSGASDPQD